MSARPRPAPTRWPPRHGSVWRHRTWAWLVSLTATSPSLAQEAPDPALDPGTPTVVAGFVADVLAGVEGGAGSDVAPGVRRTRTTLRLGGEIGPGAYPDNLVAVAALVEIEPRWALGAELRYVRGLPADLELQLGATGLLAPECLFGSSLGLAYRLAATPSASVLAGPMGQLFFAGGDLPAGTDVLWQVVLQLGVRVGSVP